MFKNRPKLRADITFAESTVVSPNARISSVSVFADLVWDRSETADARTLVKHQKIFWEFFYASFPSAYHPIITSVKEFAYACMFDPIADDISRNTGTVKTDVSMLGVFIGYMQERSLYSIENIEHAELHDYVQWLLHQRSAENEKEAKDELVTLEWVDQRVRALQLYHRYSKRVSHPLLFFPLHGESIYKYLGKKRRDNTQNRTPVIPKEVWDPYLCAALHYVEVFSGDILHAQAVLEHTRMNLLPIHLMRKGDRFHPPSYRRGVVLPKIIVLKDFARIPKTETPWRDSWSSLEELRVELFALFNACIVVIANVSGMRESELATMTVDGFKMDTSHDGLSNRYSIVSRLVKGTNNKTLAWEVNEPVYRACAVMKNLTAYARAASPQSALFLVSWYRSSAHMFQKDARKDSIGRTQKGSILPIAADAMTRALKDFASHIDTAFEGLYRLPQVDGKPWVFTMRQPRRSLAARIAREPFGAIAGMLHYKHVKVTTFLGYAGTDPTWIQDLHDEELGANEEFLEQIWEDLQDGALAGPKGKELIRDFRGTAGDIKKNALQYFIDSHRAELHVGLLNYCFFQKDTAMCLTEDKRLSTDSEPVLNACHPDRCANSCVTKQHLPKWQVQVDEALAMLSHKNVSQPQRVSLSADMEKALRIVNQIKSGA